MHLHSFPRRNRVGFWNFVVRVLSVIIAAILVIGIAGALTCLIQGLYQAYIAKEADPSTLASSIALSMRFIVRSSLLLFLFLPFFVFAIVRRSILRQRYSPPQ